MLTTLPVKAKGEEQSMSTPGNAARDLMADAATHQQWVAMYRTGEAQTFYEIAFDDIVGRLGAPADATILDAGCGSCAKSILLAARGFRVVAMDYSASALALATETVRAHGVGDRIMMQQGDLLNLPFKDCEFQYAVCWGVLMHVPELQRALAELTRVLAPGGVLVLSEGNMYSAQSLAMRTLQRMLGRGRLERIQQRHYGRKLVVRTPAGLESREETNQGTLLTRQTDMAWLIEACEQLGLRLKARVPGQFTELYTLALGRTLKYAIHALNRVWFKHVRLAGPAFGNILFFEKTER